MSDLIERQAAIDAMFDWEMTYDWDDHCREEDPKPEYIVSPSDVIEKLPSAQPEPHWIPCSLGLPENTAIVTVETKMFKHKYVCEAVWTPRWSKKAEYDNWEDCSEYNEDEDEYYVLEGWYERVHNWDEYSFVGIDDDVIAWMPLPEPWRGEVTWLQ